MKGFVAFLLYFSYLVYVSYKKLTVNWRIMIVYTVKTGTHMTFAKISLI